MWTKDQIEKSEKLLREINKTDYNEIENTYISKLDNEFGYLVICEIRSLLLNSKLVYKFSNDEYYVKLTASGNIANKVGIKTFIILKYFFIALLTVTPIVVSVIALTKSK